MNKLQKEEYNVGDIVSIVSYVGLCGSLKPVAAACKVSCKVWPCKRNIFRVIQTEFGGFHYRLETMDGVECFCRFSRHHIYSASYYKWKKL